MYKNRINTAGKPIGEVDAGSHPASNSIDLLECTDDYEDEGSYCYRCGNTGEIIVCLDDMCHGLGYCVHGDGMVTCPDCNGESAF